MKRLVRLLLVNWYRLEAKSVDIDGHTAFIGPNASGKSSLLDAIQTVLVGGDKRHLSLNPSAGEKSTRSLRDYCLGAVRDPDNAELSPEFRPREESTTYLVLCFRDEDSGEETAVGLAIHARLAQPQEHIDGRFIAPGMQLILSDLIEHTAAGPVPKPWKQLREELYRRCPVKVIPQAGEFVRELCAALSDGQRHLDPVRFLRSFNNAITFAPLRNVSDFVRQFVLEERQIRVRELQQALKHYRDIRTKTREAQEREQLLDRINQLYTRADQAERLALAYRWVEQEAAFQATDSQIEPLREGVEDKSARIAELAGRMDTLQAEYADADQAREQARDRLAATDVAQRKRRIEAERDQYRQREAQVQVRLDQVRRDLAKVHRLRDQGQALPAELEELLAALAAQVGEDDGLLEGLWPERPETVMALAGQLGPALAAAREGLGEGYEALVSRESRLKDELREIRERLGRLESGESDLSPGTQRLLALLGEHGIRAVPLCDCVDVADERWRETVESFLGGQREALLVPPEQVRDAIRLYRGVARREGLHGSRIVNTTKSADWAERAEPGSLAEVIDSDDPHARAYVNRLAGAVRRVESEEELLRHERAASDDGMLATNGAVLRMKPVESMLGREARAKRLQALQAQFQEQAAAFGQVQERKNAARQLLEEVFDPFARQVEALPDLPRLCAERAECGAALAALEAEERDLDTDQHDHLKAEYERLDRSRRDLQAQLEAAREEQARLRELLAVEQKELEQKNEELERVAQRRREAEARPGLDREEGLRRLEELEGLQDFADDAGSWRAVSWQAAERAARQEGDCAKRRLQGRDEVREYLARWPAEQLPALGEEEDHRPLAAWAAGALAQLQESELARYAGEAENALREAEHAFRADFVGRLQENLAQLDEQLRELNRNLRHRPFHGQYYSFVKKPDPEFAPIIRWIESWTPEEGGDVGGLFDAAGQADHPHREAIKRIQTLLMEAGDGEGMDERLADYRCYYSFDVKMTDGDGGNPELLSRRLGKGSGGEHQSPFYVAIGAALTAAYRLERGQDGQPRGGMALAVFDEAFSKLDVQNTVSALGFLDELGLQVILAAPDEKYGLMSEHMNTIVNVYRDGGTVHVDADYLKPAAHRLLAGDNPVKQGETEAEPAGS